MGKQKVIPKKVTRYDVLKTISTRASDYLKSDRQKFVYNSNFVSVDKKTYNEYRKWTEYKDKAEVSYKLFKGLHEQKHRSMPLSLIQKSKAFSEAMNDLQWDARKFWYEKNTGHKYHKFLTRKQSDHLREFMNDVKEKIYLEYYKEEL